MNCESVRVILEQIGRDQMVETKLRACALAHSRECRSCGVQLANERMLNAGLGLVAEQCAALEPSRFVHAALMQACRQDFDRKRRFFVLRSGAAAMAACLALILLLRVGQLPQSHSTKLLPEMEDAASAIALAAIQANVGEPGNGASFVQIPYAEPIRADERAELQRVRTTRGALAAMGLPGELTPDPDEAVTAEIVVGEDGVVRAVRLLN